MSYDLYLVRPEPGQDPLTNARVWYEREEDETVLPTPQQVHERRYLANALRAAFPELANEYEDARHIEVYGPEETGVTISCFGNETAISIPYWHTGDAAAVLLQQVARYVAFFHQEAGFVA